MKYMNIIKLLSVLLCIGMLFVACDGAKEDGTEEASAQGSGESTVTPSDEALLESVEAKAENFFEILEETGELTTAERIEGDIVSSSGLVYIVKTEKIDTKNNVTETYDIYNANEGKIVLTKTNTYFNRKYDSFDWNYLFVKENMLLVNNGKDQIGDMVPEKNYPESVLSVEIKSISGIDYILVRKAYIKPIPEEIREENPRGCVYEIKTAYEYYDICGNLITESSASLKVAEAYGLPISNKGVISISFGSKTACFDSESGELIAVTDNDKEHVKNAFEYENDMYGYCYLHTAGIANIGEVYFMDIYNKVSGETVRYSFDKNYEDCDYTFLHNGDLFIQYCNTVDEAEPYDIVIEKDEGNEYMQIKHVIYSPDDRKETAVELPYYIARMTTGEYREEYALQSYGYDISVTENARNIAFAYSIENGKRSNKCDMVIFDNDMSVLFTMNDMHEDQSLDEGYLIGYIMLPGGDRIIGLDHELFDRAIIDKDGNVRSYLTEDMRVMGDYIVDSDTVYDHDMKKICDYTKKGYTLDDLKVVFGKLVFEDKTDNTNYYLGVGESGKAVLTKVLDEKGSFVSLTDEYAIFKDVETGKYTLYNESMTAVLRTNNGMFITEFDGGYLVSTSMVEENGNTRTILYLVK